MPDSSWTLLNSRELAKYKVLRLREDRYRFEPTQTEATFAVCDSADWVMIIPFTSDDQIVFIRQYRHGSREVVTEIPGGIIDAGESPVETAARELREETGYIADRLNYLGSLLPNPALNTASCHVVVAQGCRKVGDATLDPLERIDVVLRPSAAVSEMIETGELRHCQVIAAFSLMQIRDRRSCPEE